MGHNSSVKTLEPVTKVQQPSKCLTKKKPHSNQQKISWHICLLLSQFLPSTVLCDREERVQFMVPSSGQKEKNGIYLQYSGLSGDFPRDWFLSCPTQRAAENGVIAGISDWRLLKAGTGATMCQRCRGSADPLVPGARDYDHKNTKKSEGLTGSRGESLKKIKIFNISCVYKQLEEKHTQAQGRCIFRKVL